MRIKDPQADYEEPHNLLSLIDTLFFLLVFFLVATQFKAEERDQAVQLPGLGSSQPLSAIPAQLVINIREDGSAIVAGRPYAADELERLLAVMVINEPDREVLIR